MHRNKLVSIRLGIRIASVLHQQPPTHPSSPLPASPPDLPSPPGFPPSPPLPTVCFYQKCLLGTLRCLCVVVLCAFLFLTQTQACADVRDPNDSSMSMQALASCERPPSLLRNPTARCVSSASLEDSCKHISPANIHINRDRKDSYLV